LSALGNAPCRQPVWDSSDRSTPCRSRGRQRAGNERHLPAMMPGAVMGFPLNHRRCRSSAGFSPGLSPGLDLSFLPHSEHAQVRPAALPDCKTAGQCGFRWGERGDSNPRHPGPQLRAQAIKSPGQGHSRTSGVLRRLRLRLLTAYDRS
jgi:hypothetical protein